jgi:hypothetical protein
MLVEPQASPGQETVHRRNEQIWCLTIYVMRQLSSQLDPEVLPAELVQPLDKFKNVVSIVGACQTAGKRQLTIQYYMYLHTTRSTFNAQE